MSVRLLLPLSAAFALSACASGVLTIDDDDAAADDDDAAADDDDAAGDDDDAAGDDDDAAGDDDDAVDMLDCGPVLTPGPGWDEGVYYAGEAVIEQRGEGGTWAGCEVERWYENGELACENLYEVEGEAFRLDDRRGIFFLEFQLDRQQSTCGKGPGAYEVAYRIRFQTDTGSPDLAYTMEWDGQGTDWEVFAQPEVRTTDAGIGVSYASEFWD